MDPNAAWNNFLNGDREASHALVGWLAGGGFEPTLESWTDPANAKKRAAIDRLIAKVHHVDMGWPTYRVGPLIP